MTCSMSRLAPLIGTETKHISRVQYSSSDGCSRVQSPTSPIFRIGNAVSSVSTPLMVGAFFDLNFSEKLGFTIFKCWFSHFILQVCASRSGNKPSLAGSTDLLLMMAMTAVIIGPPPIRARRGLQSDQRDREEWEAGDRDIARRAS